MAAPATCVLNAPADDAVIVIAGGAANTVVHCTGTTDASVAVQMRNGGANIGAAGAANGSGAFDISLTLTPGVYNLVARAGTAPDTLDSTPVHTISVRSTIRTQATLTWYMNWLADTVVAGVPQYTARRAMCLWAGVPVTYTMAGALNTMLGIDKGLWISVNQALNEIAGTSGLSNSGAAEVICGDA